MNLNGKTVLVTGATQPLGAAIVRRLAAEGYGIIAQYNGGSIAEIQAACQRVPFTALQADLSQPSAPLALAERIQGPLYGLVHSAGCCIQEEFLETPASHYDFLLNLNVRAPLLLTQHLAKGAERIIFFAVEPSPIDGKQVPYAAAMGAICALTRASAQALAPHGTTVNAILQDPAFVDQHATHLVQRTAPKVPVASRHDAEAAAKLVSRLLSREAAHITGQLLPLEG